jgi:hypothetical protein
MINNIKSTFSEQLSQTQELSVNNIKRLSMNLDILNEKLADKLKNIENNLI